MHVGWEIGTSTCHSGLQHSLLSWLPQDTFLSPTRFRILESGAVGLLQVQDIPAQIPRFPDTLDLKLNFSDS